MKTVASYYPHVVSAIRNAGLYSSEDGDGRIKFLCPVHEDRTPSARAWVTDNGVCLLGCWACNSRDNPGVRLAIVHALGLKWSSLCPSGRDWDRKGNLLPAATYEFFEPEGELSYRSCLWVHSDSRSLDGRRKSFTLERYENGGFLPGLADRKPSLYLLPEWIGASKDRVLFWCEGEKKAEILSKLGLLACSLHGGTNSAYCFRFDEWLRGRHVCFLPDADSQSESMVYRIAGRLMLEGIAASVRVTRLPGLFPKQDVWDWIMAYKLERSDPEIRKELMREVQKSSVYRRK